MPKKDRSLAWLNTLVPARATEGRDPFEPKRQIVFAAGSFLFVWLLAMAFQLFQLQVVHGGQYQALANGNRLRERVIYAPRGRILDRNGKPLVENTVSSQLVVYPYLLSKNATQKNESIAKVAKLIDAPLTELQSLFKSFRQDDINPHVVATKLDQPTIVALEEALPTLVAFALEDVPSRQYDARYGMGHILGYTGTVTEENLKAANYDLLPTDRVGQAGVEASFDQKIRGQNGKERIEVDAKGRPINVVARQQPIVGKDLRLTIDLELQKSLYESTKKHMEQANSNRAASVVVDPTTGDVLAMVSLPDYDDNEFNDGISQARYDELQNDPNQPLLNKVISAGYATGSIIKPLVASAALQEKVITPNTTIVDRGFIEVQNQYDSSVTYRYNGWNLAGLGPMQVRSAIAFSSNIFFFTVGGGFGDQPGLGVNRLTRYYHAFGLGGLTGINLPNEQAGRVPDPAWKKKTFDEDWFVGDTYNISIGQGDMLVTPLQITMAETAVANGGQLMRPRLSLDEPIVKNSQIPVDKTNLQIVREGMRQTVVRGTTNPAMFASTPVEVAAKSGTAETNSPGGRPPHSWYVAFAPYQKPTILGTVLVEEGKEGVVVSAPTLAEVFASYFKR